MKAALLRFLDVYKLVFSPIIGGQCRFHPSCSDYARQAIEKHDIWRALIMSAKRVLRCNPWHVGGADPVP